MATVCSFFFFVAFIYSFVFDPPFNFAASSRLADPRVADCMEVE
jgi:hypothetical protein